LGNCADLCPRTFFFISRSPWADCYISTLDVTLDTNQQQVSYIIGRDLARNFAQQGLELDIDILAAALKEGLAGAPSQLTQEQMQTAMQQLQEQLGGGEDEEDDDDTQDPNTMSNNKAEGEAFLAENAQKPGITTLPSGLQYEIITEGTGAKPTLRSSVTTHYHGTLPSGKVFDSSYQRGQPATFPVNGVIAGWTEALQLMPEGSKWRLYIPRLRQARGGPRHRPRLGAGVRRGIAKSK
jgi:FKBP-type peptidyl-prolyl cis-trans isomerase FklB